MLGKLLKYDLKYIISGMVGMYVVALIFAVITRIFGIFDKSAIMDTLTMITGMVTLILLIGVLLLNMIRVWTRFLKNMYGDESYLTHTLPVEKSTIYKSKFLAAVISMSASMVVVLVAVFTAWYSEAGIDKMKAGLTGLADIYDSTAVGMVLMFIFVLFLQETFVIQCGYTGVLAGFRADNRRIERTIAFGIISYMVSGLTAIIILLICALFNDSLMQLFKTNEMQDMRLFKQIITGASVYYAVVLGIFYMINLKLLKKGVNVD